MLGRWAAICGDTYGSWVSPHGRRGVAFCVQAADTPHAVQLSAGKSGSAAAKTKLAAAHPLQPHAGGAALGRACALGGVLEDQAAACRARQSISKQRGACAQSQQSESPSRQCQAPHASPGVLTFLVLLDLQATVGRVSCEPKNSKIARHPVPQQTPQPTVWHSSACGGTSAAAP